MIERKDIEDAVAGFLPSWGEDEDVREYLVQILMQEDSYTDRESLEDMLLPFADNSEEIVSQIVDTLAKLVVHHQATAVVGSTSNAPRSLGGTPLAVVPSLNLPLSPEADSDPKENVDSSQNK